MLLEIEGGEGAQAGEGVVADALSPDDEVVVFVLRLGGGGFVGEGDGFGCCAFEGDAGVVAACGVGVSVCWHSKIR